MTLLGDRASLPRWLDRLLPTLDIEGESLGEQPAHEPAQQSELRPGRHRSLHISGKSSLTSRDACVVAGARVNLRLVQVAVTPQRCRCLCDGRSCGGRTI
jgi:hypothetical protein